MVPVEAPMATAVFMVKAAVVLVDTPALAVEVQLEKKVEVTISHATVKMAKVAVAVAAQNPMALGRMALVAAVLELWG